MTPDVEDSRASKDCTSHSVRVNFLVIGSGISGLYFAVKAAEHGKVLVVTKKERDASATSYAQGGIAAALGEMDDPQKHYEDTMKAGAGLCDPRAVNILVHEGVERVRELVDLGMQFTRDKKGNLHLGREGGHGTNRVVHTHDYTGREVENFLLKMCDENENIEILEDCMAVDLLTEHHVPQTRGQPAENCYGAYVLDENKNEVITVIADYTLLATGGAGRVYPITTNPGVSTGDGVAMAYRAGCSVRNMEFVQFHPTALFSDADPAFLISEALRGYGARLSNEAGEYFMINYHKSAELAPRDIVARAIDSELKKSGDDCVYLDVTHQQPDKTREHFPLIYETLKDKYKIDITSEKIPVIPACHYLCGGVQVDYNGKTDLNFLYAIGETASTGVHGGNRLASNSLLEGLVFSQRALEDIIQKKKINSETSKKENCECIPEWDKAGVANLEEWVLVKHDRQEIQTLMFDYVGLVRSTNRLTRALRRIDLIYEEVRDFYHRTLITPEILELRNLALVAQLIVRSALERKESRGLHFMTDFPENRDPSRQDTVIKPRVALKDR